MKGYSSVYIHTIDGEAAYFVDGMLCFVTEHGVPLKAFLRPDLKTIRAEQRASRSCLRAEGVEPHGEYDYLRFKAGKR